MLGEKVYSLLKDKYGLVSSWAVWDEPGDKPKSNTNGMNWVNDSNLLSILNTGFVFVGRNGAGTHGTQDGHFEQPWANFHSGYSYQNDYKMRYAFRGTRYWGSYMTDIIKNYNESDSNSMRSYLKTHPEVVKENI